MKKLFISALVCSACCVSLGAFQTVEEVVEITPDKPLLTLPNPPTEITAQDVLNTSSHGQPLLEKKNAVKKEKVIKAKKAFEELSQAEQIKALKKKIDKLRQKSHSMRAKIRAIKEQMGQLKEDLSELKSAQSNPLTVQEPTLVEPMILEEKEEEIVENNEGDDNV